MDVEQSPNQTTVPMKKTVEYEGRHNRPNADRVRDIVHAIAEYQRGQGETNPVSFGATPWAASELVQTDVTAHLTQPLGL